jgi:hypothetical protein
MACPAIGLNSHMQFILLEAISPLCLRPQSGINKLRRIQLKDNLMIMTLTVFKEVHNTWPAKNGKPGGEAYDLLCMDMSNPAEHRMEEMLYYRTKDEERPRIWGKSVGTTIQVGVSKIRHGDNGGRATLIGQIIGEPKK